MKNIYKTVVSEAWNVTESILFTWLIRHSCKKMQESVPVYFPKCPKWKKGLIKY